MSIEPFHVRTCENIANQEKSIIFAPDLDTPFKPFLIQDPFGLRKAIVPVLNRKTTGDICGMGTAFHIDGWGTFLTADHVIDFARYHPDTASHWTEISQNPTGDHAVLFLGIGGRAFGRVPIPPGAFSLVEFMASPMGENHIPLMNKSEPKNVVDLAVLQASIHSDEHNIPQSHFVPVKASPYPLPSVDQTVLAVGFPELDCQQLDNDAQRSLLTEGMYGAYGRIKAIHPAGISQSNPTPVFEVECNWRQGMSGGPVFNSSGEVIGLVSRALKLPPNALGNSVGYATCFSAIPYFKKLVPTLDIVNCMWRRGWAVLRSDPWDLAGFFQTEVEAQQLASSVSPEYQVKYGSNRFGTDDFIS